MDAQRPLTQNEVPQPGAWIRSFGEVFIGLSREAQICGVLGAAAISPELQIREIEGLTWPVFVERYAHPAAQAGLHCLWQAVAQGAVAPEYWPPMVPFSPGVVARLRPVTEDPGVCFAVHLASAQQARIDPVLSGTLHDALSRLAMLSQSISRGVHGPLTDSQVRAIGAVQTLAENVSQLLNQLRAEFTAPAASAPLPHAVHTLLNFSTADFSSIRRVKTHQLRIAVDLPDDLQSYCHASLRDGIRHVLGVLLGAISERSAIRVWAEDLPRERAIRLTIAYQTKERGLCSSVRVEPVSWRAAHLARSSSTLQQLVNALQAHLLPGAGRVWAEPAHDRPEEMQLCAILPRWTPPS